MTKFCKKRVSMAPLKSDSGQHLQFLRCFCKNVLESAHRVLSLQNNPLLTLERRGMQDVESVRFVETGESISAHKSGTLGVQEQTVDFPEAWLSVWRVSGGMSGDESLIHTKISVFNLMFSWKCQKKGWTCASQVLCLKLDGERRAFRILLSLYFSNLENVRYERGLQCGRGHLGASFLPILGECEVAATSTPPALSA